MQPKLHFLRNIFLKKKSIIFLGLFILAAVFIYFSYFSDPGNVYASSCSLTMQVSPSGSGSTEPSRGDHWYTCGDYIGITAHPASGWEFDYWAGDASGTSRVPSPIYLDRNKIASAHFKQVAPTCNCGSWTGHGCGGAGCPADHLGYTRSCNPSGCEDEHRCVLDVSCTQPTCSCTSWVDLGCGGGVCASDKRGYTRTCTPSGCDYVNTCLSDAACAPPPCSCTSWVDLGCGGGVCAPDKRGYTRTCTPSGCDYVNTCLSDIACAPGDTTPPAISIAFPSKGETVLGTVNFRVSASDASGIREVRFYINDNRVHIDTTFPYIYPWDTTTYSNGSYKLHAWAQDGANNWGATPDPNYTVTVDNAPPACDCGSWTDHGCGGAGCSSDHRGETRSCNPSGCNSEYRCVPDVSCAPPACICDPWASQGCGGAGCASDERGETRPCTPSGCDPERRCLSDPACAPPGENLPTAALKSLNPHILDGDEVCRLLGECPLPSGSYLPNEYRISPRNPLAQGAVSGACTSSGQASICNPNYGGCWRANGLKGLADGLPDGLAVVWTTCYSFGASGACGTSLIAGQTVATDLTTFACESHLNVPAFHSNAIVRDTGCITRHWLDLRMSSCAGHSNSWRLIRY